MKLFAKIAETWRRRRRQGVGGHKYVVTDRVPLCMGCNNCTFDRTKIPCNDCIGLNYSKSNRSYFVRREATKL